MRRRAVALAVAVAVLGAVGVATVVAAPSDPIAIGDARGDVTGALDVQGATLRRAGDGRVRATVTLTRALVPGDLRAESGPPGSICLRVWTARGADPRAEPADRLVCVTADARGRLRAGVLDQSDGDLPRRAGSATVSQTRSRRSLIVRVAQSALGRPERIRVAFETTRPGCDRVSCVDTAPDAPATRAFRLR